MRTKIYTCYICVGELGPFDACSLVGASVSVSLYVLRLVDSVCFPVCVLTSLAILILLFHLLPDSLSSA
jgi:hypothetical protein